MSHFSGAWEQLPPGLYEVRVRYRHYRYGDASYRVTSNAVALRIVAKR